MNKFEYKKLTPFKWFVLENFPFIEADFDALTEWQLFCKLGKEINKVINSTNILGTQVETLTDYVSNYFDNLNIQTEINNKLNEMAESGELTEIIAQYLNLNAVLTFDTLNDLKNAENIVNGSVAKTLGTDSYNDGKGFFYKIRNITYSDIVDNDNIVQLNISSTLIAEKIKNYQINQLENKTMFLTPEQFGAKGDGTTDDSQAFENMIQYISNNVPVISFVNEASCKDYSKISIIFSKKYAVSKPIIFSNTYGLNLENLRLIATDNFVGENLLVLNNVTREFNLNNSILNGNMKVNNCLYLSDYSLVTRFINCQFTRFLKFGFYANSKGHEILMTNCKINQVEWGEFNNSDLWNTLASGTGIFLDTERYDNHFTNIIINYCKLSTLQIKSTSNWFNNCHFYGGLVNIEGSYNYFTDCYFDGTIIKLPGFNYIKGCFIKGDLEHFIEITENFENNWKYQYTYLINSIFRNDVKNTNTPIIFSDDSWSGNELKFGLQCTNNTFYQVTPFNYQAPNVYNPDPTKYLNYTGNSISNGSFEIGDLLVQYGTIEQTDTTNYINFPLEYTEYVIGVILVPEYAGETTIPFANDISTSRFWANGVKGSTKWYAVGRMLPK